MEEFRIFFLCSLTLYFILCFGVMTLLLHLDIFKENDNSILAVLV
jgi:hypothetical protein